MRIKNIKNCYFKFVTKGFFCLLITTILFISSGFTIPKNLLKKVNKQITKTFIITDFELEPCIIPTDLNTKVLQKNNLSSIKSEGKVIGYVLVDKADSRSYEFDYSVLFNSALEIVNIKILIYREEHGNEISSKRWLRQFFGFKANNRAVLQENIDGISGATISVRNMTTKMDNILQDLVVIEKNNILPTN